MIIRGTITDYDPERGAFLITAPYSDPFDVARKEYKDVEIRIEDGRSVSNDQRRKARAIVADICNWAGYEIAKEFDQVHQILKAYFCAECGFDWFSLSDTDMTTARRYISYLIDFCLKNDVPCLDTLLNRTDDIAAYIYSCLYYQKCAICGKKSETHHVDKIGMGNDRREVEHVGRLALPLCTEHHREAHDIGQTEFNELYHIFPIALDEILVKRLKL